MDTISSARPDCNSATVEDATLAEESCKDILNGGTVGCSMASSPGVVLAEVVW